MCVFTAPDAHITQLHMSHTTKTDQPERERTRGWGVGGGGWGVRVIPCYGISVSLWGNQYNGTKPGSKRGRDSKSVNCQITIPNKLSCAVPQVGHFTDLPGSRWPEGGCHSAHTAYLPFKVSSKLTSQCGAGIAQWLEHRTRDWKVAGSNPCWNGGRIFFTRVDFLCWLLFRYPFHPRVTTVARKKSRSFCQKCRWQVTAKHAYTLRMWILLNRASALVTTCP